MTDIVWEEPPTKTSRPGNGDRYADFWEQLRNNPGQWARYPGTANSLGVQKKRHPDIEFTTRKIDGERVGYARYIGDRQPA